MPLLDKAAPLATVDLENRLEPQKSSVLPPVRGATFAVIRTLRTYEPERSGGRGFPSVTVTLNGTTLSVVLTHDSAVMPMFVQW